MPDIDWERAESARRVALLKFDRVGGTAEHRGLEEAVAISIRRAISMVADFCVLPISETAKFTLRNVKPLVTSHQADVIVHGTVEIPDSGDIKFIIRYWASDGKKDSFTESAPLSRLHEAVTTATCKMLEALGVMVDDEFKDAMLVGLPPRGELFITFGNILTDPVEEQTVQAFDFLETDVSDFVAPMLFKAGICMESDPAQAEEILYSTIARDPYNTEAYIMLSHLLGRRFEHRNREALDVLINCLLFAPACGEAHHEAGLLLAQIGRPTEAGDHLEMAAYLLPGCPDVQSDYATLLWKEFDDLTEAKKLYEKAIELSPKTPLYYANLAGVLADLGELEAAAVRAREASDLEMPPQKPKAAESEAAAEPAVKPPEDFFENTMFWAEMARLAGNDEAALEALGRILEHDPEHSRAKILRSSIMRDSENNS